MGRRLRPRPEIPARLRACWIIGETGDEASAAWPTLCNPDLILNIIYFIRYLRPGMKGSNFAHVITVLFIGWLTVFGQCKLIFFDYAAELLQLPSSLS